MSNSARNHEAIAAAAARWVSRRDAGLSVAERAEFERWRAADPRHKSALQHYAATWSVLDRPRQGNAILRELGVRQHRQRRRRCAAIAILAIAVGAGAGALRPWRQSIPIVADAVASTLPGGVLLVPERRVLPDGSVVEVKSGAEIAVEFSPTLRRVVLRRGEAHFQVAKNPDRPFTVEADGVQVRAVGTAFSVQRDVTQIDVLVTEGRVAVEKTANIFAAAVPPESPESESLSPRVERQTIATAGAGQRVIVPAVTRPVGSPLPAVVSVSATELAERLAWRAPRVEFSTTPLSEAIAMMNHAAARREERGRLVIDASSAALGREPISGIFRADSTDAFVRMLELSLGVQSERRGDHIVLRSVP